MKKFFFFLLVSFNICLFTSVSSPQSCIGVLNGHTSSRPSCPYPFGTRYDWRDTDLVSWGDGSPGRQWVRSGFGQCRSGLNCPPTVGAIVHSPGIVSQRWKNGLTALYQDVCADTSEIIYTQRPDACTTCGNQTGVPCGGDECFGGFFLENENLDDPNLLPEPGCCDASERIACELSGAVWDTFTCTCISPIVIDVAGNGFNLTNAKNGVLFDILNHGTLKQVSWTAANSDDAWLALDRNGNGRIDRGRELFGSSTPQPALQPGESKNGFRALAVYDRIQRGGNGDGKINQQDGIFQDLKLWQDANHNGISEPAELHGISELGLRVIELDYTETRRQDENGNWFRYRARVRDTQGSQIGRWAWDVFLDVVP